jgi:prevent-host-death family protein
VSIAANEFRNHFGWYMERASAGESFLISRRGKPYARITPPFAQLIESPKDSDRPRLEVVG